MGGKYLKSKIIENDVSLALNFKHNFKADLYFFCATDRSS
jgi:hypothetical protein